MQVCCIVPLRSDVGLVALKGAAYLMSSPMVALVVKELVMLMYNQRLNEKGAVSWDLDYLHSCHCRHDKCGRDGWTGTEKKPQHYISPFSVL